jgi:hypothetical protein
MQLMRLVVAVAPKADGTVPDKDAVASRLQDILRDQTKHDIETPFVVTDCQAAL